MAVTIHDTPQQYTPSDNPVLWTFSSDQTAQVNFAYLVKVYINDVLDREELVFPENGINARYDAQAWASNGCGQPTIPTTMHADALNYCDVRITVVEFYGDPPAEQASSAASNIRVWKSGLQNEDFINWDHTAYVPALGSAPYLWLSAFPSGQNRVVKRTGELLYMMALTNETANTLTVELFDSNDVSVASDTLVLTNYKVTIFKLDPEQIVADMTITDDNFTDSAYYTVKTANFAETRIDLDESCVYPRYQRLHFLSQIGSIEAFTFELVSFDRATIKAFGYKRVFGEWNGSSFEFNEARGVDVDYVKQVSRFLEVESNWLQEDIQHWLVKNMYSAVLVYQEVILGTDKAPSLVERKIIATAYKFMYGDNNTLFKEKVSLALPSQTTMNL